MELIKIQLSKSDVKNGLIRPTNYKEKFQKKDYVYINDIKASVSQNGTRISKLTPLHRQNHAQNGMWIELVPLNIEDHYSINYNANNELDFKDNIKNEDVNCQHILDAFSGMISNFKKIFYKWEFYPSRNKNGFAERNISFNFCNQFLMKLGDNAIVWQEYSLPKSQSMDSIIFEKNDKLKQLHIYYIEAKRIKRECNINGDSNSILSDYLRAYDCITKYVKGSKKVFPGLSGTFIKDYNIIHHILLLSATEDNTKFKNKIEEFANNHYLSYETKKMELKNQEIKDYSLYLMYNTIPNDPTK